MTPGPPWIPLGQAARSPYPFVELAGSGRAFAALTLAIVVLLLCALLFAVIAGVLRYRNRRKEREWLIRERKWEGPLLEVLAGGADPSEVQRLVGKDEALYFVDYLLHFARRMRGEVRETLSELARPHLGPVLDRLRHGDPERRARAVETIALLAFEEQADRMVAALDDPSPLVSMVAARHIARHRDAGHVRLILEHLAHLQTWSPRQLAAILSSMGAGAAPVLRAALADPTCPAELRAISADALRALCDPEAGEVAAAVLPDATGRDLVAAVLRLLAVLGRPEHAPVVLSFCSAEDAVVRAAAMQALAATGAAQNRALLRDGLDDPSGWVAIRAARALRDIGDAASLRALAGTEHRRSALARQVLVEGT